MKIIFNGKGIDIGAKKLGSFGKVRGLMFLSRQTGNLLFEFDKDVKIGIHSWFVFFPFLAVWLDSKDSVVDTRVVRPFSFYISPKKSFRKLLEIPMSETNEKLVKLLVGKGKV